MPMVVGMQNITKGSGKCESFLLDGGITCLHHACPKLQMVSATVLARDTPLHVVEQAVGRHQVFRLLLLCCFVRCAVCFGDILLCYRRKNF